MAAVDSFILLYKEIARSCNCYVETLALVGALYTASKALLAMRECYCLIRVHFVPRLTPKRDLIHRFGEWAVVCDASQPIAKAYAEELARRGVNIILIGPKDVSVGDAARTIADTYGVHTVLVVVDFSQGHTVSKPIKNALKDKEVGFLVNCAATSLGSACVFAEVSEEKLWDSVNSSVAATTLITRLVLPGMVERKRGTVVNISSGSCFRPTPGKAVLSASTAYFDSFSQALHHEYGHCGIFVQSLLPFWVASLGRGTGQEVPSDWLVPRPEVYARHAISTLGISHRTTGYWPHTLQFGLMQRTPEWLWVLGSRMLTSYS